MADTNDPPVVEFDRGAAQRFRPSADFTKVAVLVDVADPDSVTVLKTKFGTQHMRGPFYVVAEGTGSYGAAQAQFEHTHREDGGQRWVKTEPVLAYRADRPCTVETHLDNHREATVVADRGDWIVMQAGGEIMVVDNAAFAERYVPDEALDERRNG